MFESIQIKTIPNLQIEAVLNYDLKGSKRKPNHSKRRDSLHRSAPRSVWRGLVGGAIHQEFFRAEICTTGVRDNGVR